MPEPLRAADAEQAERLHTFAHDVKNRLVGLWEVLGMLRSGVEGIEQDELMAFAERGFFGAQHDIETLLDDLRVDRGIILKDMSPIDPGACLQEAIAKEKYRFAKKEQRIRVDGSLDARVIGDAHWIILLLQALISNASKFSARGSSVLVELESRGNNIAVRVIDQGVGLSNEDMPNLFKRYALLGSRGTENETQSRGTLAKAKQWAEAHGGTLTAQSEGIGHGSAFTLLLPVAN